MFELLAWTVLREFRGDRQRDVSRVCARAVVAGGQPELQLVSCELARWCRKRVADELHLRRRVHRAERRTVFGMRCWTAQECVRLERVCELPRRDVFEQDRVECVYKMRIWFDIFVRHS